MADLSVLIADRLLEKSEYIYIFRMTDTNYFKIGFSRKIDNVYKRLMGCQTGNPKELIIVAIYQIQGHARGQERGLHRVLKDYRMKGEWFNFDNECLKFMENFAKLDTINLIQDNFETIKLK